MAAGDIVQDYLQFMDELERGIQTALYTTMRDGLIEELQKSAEKKVYSYNAKPYFKEQRRGKIAGRNNLSADVTGTTLTLTNLTSLQIGEAGEVNIVEEGMAAWNQPYPRPFMEEGLQEYAKSPRAERDLNESLAAQGFIVKDY